MMDARTLITVSPDASVMIGANPLVPPNLTAHTLTTAISINASRVPRLAAASSGTAEPRDDFELCLIYI